MSEEKICPLCGLPKELCVCSRLSTESQRIVIYNGRRKWGKVVTLVKFENNDSINIEEIMRKAKRKFGSGGTVRDKNTFEIRGDQRFKLKKLLMDLGYDKESIVIK